MYAEVDTGTSLPDQAALTAGKLAAVTEAATGRPVRDPRCVVTPIRYDWGSPATAGLWRADVGGCDGTLACTYFVKLLRHTRLWPGLRNIPTEEYRAEFIAYFPWRAELDMYESGIGSVLPSGMRTPVLHHVKHADADHLALWWEFVPERPEPWELADYKRAAYLLGRLAGRRREGAEVNRTLPSICRDPHPAGTALRFYTQRRVMLATLPMLEAGSLWCHPLVAGALRQVADPGLPEDMVALGRRLPHVLDMLDGLPQTYAHGDASPQNLLLPVSEPGTIVVIDWGFGTLLPVGFDLGQLLAGLASAGQADPADLPGIDAAIFPAYLGGLSAEGWDPAPESVRAGYLGGLAARSALCTLPVELLGSGAAPEEMKELFATRLRLARVLIDLTTPALR